MISEVNKFLGEYLDYLEIEKNRSKKTRENYKHYIGRFLDWSGVVKPDDINDEVVRKYRLYLNRLENKNNISLKKATQNYHIIALRGFLKYLARRDVDTMRADKIELGKAPSRDIDFLESEEVERLLSSPNTKDLRGLRDKAILEILFSTGLRVSELCSLNRNSVDLSREEFSVRGKGDKVRVVFLSSAAKENIKIYLTGRSDVDDALFVRIPKGGDLSKHDNLRLTPRSVQRLVKKYAAAAGLTKDIHPHTLRHSFATDLLRNGADLRSVQALLGHANITTTQVYTHVTDKQLREVHQAFHALRRNSGQARRRKK